MIRKVPQAILLVSAAVATIATNGFVAPGHRVFGADPAKDPLGWSDVRIGMTTVEFSAAMAGQILGDASKLAALRPLMLDGNGTIDLPAALAAAERLKERGGGGDAAEAATQLLKLHKRRPWKVYEEILPSAINRNPRPILARQFSGILDSFMATGFSGNGTYQLIVKVHRKDGDPLVSTSERLLDKASQRYLTEVTDAVWVMSDFLAREEKNSEKFDESFTGTIRAKTVVVRGISLNPEIEFAEGRVSRVHLGTPGSDNPATPPNPNIFGMHLTLVDALSEKFGQPDERNQNGPVHRVVWRFPKTVISCSAHRLGLEVFYEPPNASNVSGVDKL